MLRPLIQACLLISLAAILGGCNGGHGGVGAPALSSISISPAGGIGAAGSTTQLTASGEDSNGGRSDVTNQVTWASSSAAVAGISSGGKVTASAAGTTNITASLNGLSATTTFTVSAPVLISVEITPPTPRVASGRTLQLAATGIYSNNTTQDLTAQVTWSSSNTSVTSISAAGGVAAAAGVGAATITATSNGISGTATLTVTPALLVSIQVTPATPSVAKGLALQLTATGLFSDNSTQNVTGQSTWTSSNNGVATVSATGLAAAANLGSATMSATIGTISGNASITVTPAVLESIQVTPTTPSYPKGVSAQQLTATGIFSDNSTQNLTGQVTWTSSNTAAVTVSNAPATAGQVRAVGVGSSSLAAALNSISGNTTVTVAPAILVSIQVTPSTPSIAKGLTLQFTATGIYTDNTTQDLTTTAVWGSSATNFATISNANGSQGLASAANVGPTIISATSASISGSTNFTVTPAVLVSIQVTPTNSSIAKGIQKQFTATGLYTDNSTQDLTTMATWSSSNTNFVTISNAAGSNGLASTPGQGPVSLSAAVGTVSGSTGFTVTPATLVSIQVIPATFTLANGTTQQFAATGTYTDGTQPDLTMTVTWMSSATNVATISNAAGSQGLAKAVNSTGSTMISAISGTVTGTATLNATAASVTSITVTPVNGSIAKGLQQQFQATGHYSDGTTGATGDVTTAVTWASSAMAVATISNATGSKGLLSTLATGPTMISAVYAPTNKMDSTPFTVNPAYLTNLAVTTSNAAVAIGATQNFTATGTLTDGSTPDLTSIATWSSSDTSIATVTNSSPKGVVTGVAAGTSSISATASVGGVSQTGNTNALPYASFTLGTNVYGILATCQGSTCHSASTHIWQYTLGDSGTTYKSLLGNTTAMPPVYNVVHPNDTSGSLLYTQACTGSPPAMPYTAWPGYDATVNFALTSTECAIIASWIASGAPEN